jgi:hypothetical protein
MMMNAKVVIDPWFCEMLGPTVITTRRIPSNHDASGWEIQRSDD